MQQSNARLPPMLLSLFLKIRYKKNTYYRLCCGLKNVCPVPNSPKLDMPFVKIMFLDPANILSTWIRRVLQFVYPLPFRLIPSRAADPIPFALGTTAAISVV